MPIGKDSLKRAATSKKTAKAEEKEQVASIVEVAVSDISYRAAKACPVLFESIKNCGVLVPVVLAKDGASLKVIDGAKRLNALKELGVSVVKAVVLDGDAKKIKDELKKCVSSPECTAKAAQSKAKDVDVKEEKFNLVKRLGDDDFPVYLL